MSWSAGGGEGLGRDRHCGAPGKAGARSASPVDVEVDGLRSAGGSRPTPTSQQPSSPGTRSHELPHHLLKHPSEWHLTSTAHVDNVVHGLRLALTQGRGGEACFIADDGDVTYREFLTAYAGAFGIVLPDRALPGAVVRPVADVVDAVARALGWA